MPRSSIDRLGKGQSIGGGVREMVDGPRGVATRRSLGDGPLQAAAGDHDHGPLILKLADETIANSATLQNDDELLVKVTPYQQFCFEFVLFVKQATSSAADFKVAITVPSSPTLIIYGAVGLETGSTATANSNMSSTWVSTGGTAISLGTVADENVMIRGAGTFRNGANAGTFQVQWAQNSAVNNNLTVYGGSYLKFIEVTD